MAGVVEVVVDYVAIEAMTTEEWWRTEMELRGSEVARIAQGNAPRRTGAGAASIAAEAVMVPGIGWCADISWDQAHGYMRYTDEGTRYIAAQRYLEQALNQGV